jgi:diguanylate cyclase (GGDEF)-like protein
MGETLTSIMSNRHEMSAKLKDTSGYLAIALDNMARGVSMYDERQRLILCNKMYGELYGIPKNLTQPGTPLSAIIRWYIRTETGNDGAVDVSGQLEWIKREVAILAQGKTTSRVQKLFNGRTIKITTQPLPNGGWVDVQEDMSAEACEGCAGNRDAAVSPRDPLTGLLNRQGFADAFAELMRQGGNRQGCVVHVVDVGAFQSLKGTHGFDVRDAFLKEFGRALNRAIESPSGPLRIDGDVFAVLQTGLLDQESATLAGRRLETTLSAPFSVFGHDIDAEATVASLYVSSRESNGDQALMDALKLLLVQAQRRRQETENNLDSSEAEGVPAEDGRAEEAPPKTGQEENVSEETSSSEGAGFGAVLSKVGDDFRSKLMSLNGGQSKSGT